MARGEAVSARAGVPYRRSGFSCPVVRVFSALIPVHVLFPLKAGLGNLVLHPAQALIQPFHPGAQFFKGHGPRPLKAGVRLRWRSMG